MALLSAVVFVLFQLDGSTNIPKKVTVFKTPSKPRRRGEYNRFRIDKSGNYM